MKIEQFTRLSKASLLAVATLVLASPAYAYGPRDLYKSPVLTTAQLQAQCPTVFEGGAYGPRQMRQVSTECQNTAASHQGQPALMWSTYGPRAHLVVTRGRCE